MSFYRQLSSPIARAAFLAHQAAGRLGLPDPVRRPLRFLVRGRYVSERMTLLLRPGAWDAWTAHPGHEPETHAYIERTFSPEMGAMLDVGAFCGSFSLRHAAQFSRLVAFEASSRNFEALCRNIAACGGGAEAVQAAVAAEPGTLRLYLSADDTNSLIGAGAYEEVTAIALDGFWIDRQRFKVALLKIDVEGSEPDVIRGAGELLKTWPAVIAEANSDAEERVLTALMAEHGYRHETTLDQRNLLFLHR